MAAPCGAIKKGVVAWSCADGPVAWGGEGPAWGPESRVAFRILAAWEVPTPEAPDTELLLSDGTKFVLVSGCRLGVSVAGLV